MNAKNAFESAIELHLSGALSDAEVAYRSILADYPLYWEAQHYLGILLHQKGDTLAGIALISHVMESDHENASRYNDLGNIYVEIDDLLNATLAFQKSLRLDNQDANVWNNYGSVLHRKKNVVAAENAYRMALDQDNHFVPALSNLSALLAEKGNKEEASWYECLAYIQPPYTGKSKITLGTAYYRLNRISEAAAWYREWLDTDPENAFAQHHLAGCTGIDVPSKASAQYLKTIFNDFAEHFDEKLVADLAYRGPEIIAELIADHLEKKSSLDILDGGCGTGLCASVLKPFARQLTGVDISSGMLAKALEKNVYDHLIELELTAYLQNQYQMFDVISLADTLIYFGELTTLFAGIQTALRPGGVLVFTVEVLGDLERVESVLNPSGRYAHSREYLTRLLINLNFTILCIQDVVIRREIGEPVIGLGILAFNKIYSDTV